MTKAANSVIGTIFDNTFFKAALPAMRRPARSVTVAAISILALLSVPACGSKPAPSHDAAKFAELVDLAIPLTNPRWEVFSTPEDDGWLPSSNEIVTLVAEFDIDRRTRQFIARLPPAENVWLAPNAVRPWLAKRHQAMLARHVNSEVNGTQLGRTYGCHRFKARVTSSSRPLDGFICPTAQSAFVYFTLQVAF